MIWNALKEDLIHYIWKTKNFNYTSLKTSDDVPLKILNWGNHNSNSGPDFSNGKIELDTTVWAGNVEMHINSSDWNKHKHSEDSAYDNVILHVVWNHDCEIFNQNNQAIPTLIISQYVESSLLNKYALLMHNELRIPCENLITTIDLGGMNLWLHKILIERIESKTGYINNLLIDTKNDWNQVFFITLSKYMGLKINAQPFEQLARSFDVNIILKIGDNLSQIEALLFGQAGMLSSIKGDDYYQLLRAEYTHLAKKYNLKEIEVVSWKFARMRPANFPTLRLAQLASIMFHHKSIFSKILAAEKVEEIYKLLKVNPSNYWNSHYRFNKYSVTKEKPIGDNIIQIIIINVVVPLLFVYGKQHDNQSCVDKSIQFLESTKPEVNKITRLWKELGVKAKSAYFSQSLIQLKTQYCDHKKCMNCSVGNQLIGQ